MGSTISALKGTARAGERFANASAGALKSAISAATNAVAEGASGRRRGGGGGSVQVVDSGWYSGGVSDLSDYLRQQQTAQTEAALRKFQTKYGLGVDGIAGNATWSKLLGK